MAVLCSPRRIRSSDRGKGDRLKCGTHPAFCYVGRQGTEFRVTIELLRLVSTKVASTCVTVFNVNRVSINLRVCRVNCSVNVVEKLHTLHRLVTLNVQ